MFNENETFFNCPFCFEKISMVFETLYGKQIYIEDCEVCCRAIEVKYRVEDQKVIIEDVKRAFS